MQQNNKTAVVFDYPVVSRDCAEALQNLGYNVTYITNDTLQTWQQHLPKNKPRFLLSINYQSWISDLAEQLKIPYISWIIDTPHFNLYHEKNKEYNYTYWFVYDELAVMDLNQKGFKRVYYAPVAANVTRLNKIQLTPQEQTKYCCDISLLGNTCIQNEYSQIMKPRMDTELQNVIEQIIQAQMFNESFIISDILTEKFANDLFEDTGIQMKTSEFQGNVTAKDILCSFLGRYHTLNERKYLANQLGHHFHTHIYGDSSWQNFIPNNAYKGTAEHFLEMPKVFKASKINLNVIRSFVQSGLPMRVFDVLGSGGFLLTNHKKDITKFFKEGQDLAIYRDEQDFFEMVEYYLNHDEKREEIAKNGQFTVSQFHTFERRLHDMLLTLKISN